MSWIVFAQMVSSYNECLDGSRNDQPGLLSLTLCIRIFPLKQTADGE